MYQSVKMEYSLNLTHKPLTDVVTVQENTRENNEIVWIYDWSWKV